MRCICNVATGRYVAGQNRLMRHPHVRHIDKFCWTNEMPPGSPDHHSVPYAFKAYALAHAAGRGYTTLLWADSSIVPHQSLDGLWERIEREGCWISRNGYRNSEWTAKSAYAELGVTEEENEQIEHVVATTFGVSLAHPVGRRVFDEYFRLAQTKAFCGPWTGGVGVQHRHDQTALSVCAWRAGVELTLPPAWFCYRGGETADTVLIADGAY